MPVEKNKEYIVDLQEKELPKLMILQYLFLIL